MLDPLECIEEFAGWHSSLKIERIPVVRTSKKVSSFSRPTPAMALPANETMRPWLIRSGLSPQASFPVSQIGFYTDFA